MSMLPPAGAARLNDRDFWIHEVTPERIRRELDAGADINQPTLSQDSAIVWAGNAMAGEDVWRLLVEQGADLTALLHDRRPAIFWVTKGGPPQAVRHVMAQPGVDIHLLDSVGRNALAHATRLQPDLQVYRILVEAGIAVHQRDVNGRTAVHEAAMRTSYVHVLEYLATLGLEYSALDNHGWDAFRNAAWRNPNVDVVTFLAGYSDLGETGHDGLNPAMLAAENNPSGEVFAWLLDHDLSVEGRDADGATALVRAGRNSSAVLRQLIGLGQDVNARDDRGNSAFIVSPGAKGDAAAVFELLSAAGADVHAVNADGENALLRALTRSKEREAGPDHALLLIRDYGLATDLLTARGDGALGIAARARQPRCVIDALLHSGLAVDTRDGDGWTPLMRYAARGYDVETISTLLEAGADPHLRNPDGHSVIELAADNPSLAGLPKI